MADHVDTGAARKIAAEGWIYGYAILENYRTMYPQAIDAADPRYVGGFCRIPSERYRRGVRLRVSRGGVLNDERGDGRRQDDG